MSEATDKERSKVIETLQRDNRRYIKALAMWQHWAFDITGRPLNYPRENLVLEVNEEQQEKLRAEVHAKLTRWSASGRPTPKPVLNYMEQAERAAKAWPGIVARMEADLLSFRNAYDGGARSFEVVILHVLEPAPSPTAEITTRP